LHGPGRNTLDRGDSARGTAGSRPPCSGARRRGRRRTLPVGAAARPPEHALARIDLNDVTRWITAAVLAHPDGLAAHLATRLAISRRSAATLIRRLEAAQWIARDGTSRHARWRPGLLRQAVHRYALADLDEALPWARDFAPLFTLNPTVARNAQHGFTELLNNAIDHSGGTCVTVSVRQTPTHLQLLVSDDGCGLFDRIGEAFHIADPALAMLALSKGKLTSQPERHTGRGLYFTARIADVLDLHANHHAFQHRAWQRHQWQRTRAMPHPGTSVFVAIALDSTLGLDEVMRAHSADGLGMRFERTVVPLRLMTAAQVGLESRAQARCVAERLGQFRRAEIDFSGIATIGHAFADELFRVIPRAHPALQLVPVHATAQVTALIDSVTPDA
jgi:anti-sigma regulatory factor (Ser/Thr protein kinase)